MERDVGGGIGMGYTCKSMADSFQCMTKPTTIKKINLKKKMFVFDVLISMMGLEGEVGGGLGMGNTCKSLADSFQCMTKPTTI